MQSARYLVLELERVLQRLVLVGIPLRFAVIGARRSGHACSGPATLPADKEVALMSGAVREARRFLQSVRGENGEYRIDHWPPVRSRPWWRRRAGPAVARLRLGQRLTLGFLDPVDDALFLVAGLRRLGYPASFHLGREVAPAAPVAGFFAWVEHAGQVISTSLPVRETYLEVHRSEPR